MAGSKMSSGSGNSVPRIMVFRPTMEEFKDFSKYIEKIESLGAHKAGLAKIIPPPGWTPRKNGYDDVDLIIPSPISQLVSGREGLYQQFNIQKKAMTVKEFQKLAEGPKYRTPPHFDYEDLERKYWKNIAFNSPIYGADVSGSLYDDGVNEFNIQNLNTILDLVKEDYQIQIEGVNTAYLYFGMWKTTFAWHTEDMDLYSINYLHYGAPKSWYAIPPEHGRRLERLAENFFSVNSSNCSAFLRHKMTIISPQRLKSFSIPCNKITQEPGEFMITFPYGYHSGFNHGFNCAESTNFASTRWVEYGKRAVSCTCRNDCVKICMDMFVRKFQPERYELWKMGKDIGAHPEEPSKYYAAPAPKKVDLALAAQRERKKAKLEASQKSKRLPISRMRKRREKYKIELTNKDIRNDDSGSEATEIYDVGIVEDAENEAKDCNSPHFAPEQLCGNILEPAATSTIANEDETKVKIEQVDEACSSQMLNDGDKPTIDRIPSPNSAKEISPAVDIICRRQLPSLKPFWDLENQQNGPSPFDGELLSQFPALREAIQSGSITFFPTPSYIASSNHSSSRSHLSILPSESPSPSGPSSSAAQESSQSTISSPTLDRLSKNADILGHCRLKPKVNLKKMCMPINCKQTSSNKWMCQQTQGLKVRLAKKIQQNLRDEISAGSSSDTSQENSDCLFTKIKTPLQPQTKVSPLSTSLSSCSDGEDTFESSNGKAEAQSSANSTDKCNTKTKKLSRVKRSDEKSKKEHKKRKASSRTIRAANDRLGNWARPILRLYQHYPFNFDEEQKFNTHCSSIGPHCAICMIFSPSNITDSYPNSPRKLPANSKVKMPTFCFGKGSDNQAQLDSSPLLFQDGTSPLLVCSMCKVSVHASCYGVTMLQMGLWTCTRCLSTSMYEIECCLCVMRGGALKPTNDGRWAHILCAVLIPEIVFDDVIVKEPINVSQLTANRQRLKCKYCFKAALNLSTNQGACVQCLSGKCYLPFHVTCGYMAGVLYEVSDWPELLRISCTAHSGTRRKPVKRVYTTIHVDDKVLAKHKTNRRYYWVHVRQTYRQEYYSVLFEDNSTSTNTLPEDIIDREFKEKDLSYNEKIKVKWTDGITYNGKFKGSRFCTIFVVEFDDGTLITQERHQLYASDENIPKEILSKVGTATESLVGNLYKPVSEGKRLRVSNTKYKSFES